MAVFPRYTPEKTYDRLNLFVESSPRLAAVLAGAGAGALTGYGAELLLSNAYPDINLGWFPELAGAAGGAYLGYKLSEIDKKNSARLILYVLKGLR